MGALGSGTCSDDRPLSSHVISAGHGMGSNDPHSDGPQSDQRDSGAVEAGATFAPSTSACVPYAASAIHMDDGTSMTDAGASVHSGLSQMSWHEIVIKSIPSPDGNG